MAALKCVLKACGETNLPADTRRQVLYNQAVLGAHRRRIPTATEKFYNQKMAAILKRGIMDFQSCSLFCRQHDITCCHINML